MVSALKRSRQTDPLSSPFMPLGMVLGNNGLKVVGRGRQSFISSIVLRNPEASLGDSHSSEGVLLEVINSPDKAINGQSFYVGRDAEALDKQSCERVAIADDGKRQLFKPVILAGLGLLPIDQTANYGVFLSAPYKALAAEYQTLDGVYRLRLNGEETIIVIKVLGVRPESHGAAFYLARQRQVNQLPAQGMALIDLGEGNITILGADGNGKLISHTPLDGGVGELIRSIAHSDESIRMNRGFPASHESVRLGIESKLYTFGGTNHGKDFRQQYEQALPRWIKPKLDLIQATAKDVLDRSPCTYVIGGGALLQGIHEHFPSHWQTAANPQFIDAQGLELMAASQLRELGVADA